MGVVRQGRIDHKKPSVAERRAGQHGGEVGVWSSEQEGAGFLSSMMSKGRQFLAKHPAVVAGIKGGFEGAKSDGLRGALSGAIQGAQSQSANLRRLLKRD